VETKQRVVFYTYTSICVTKYMIAMSYHITKVIWNPGNFAKSVLRRLLMWDKKSESNGDLL
jgi:hypothetical protein